MLKILFPGYWKARSIFFLTSLCNAWKCHEGLVNQFHAAGLFLYPLKTPENLWFSDIFRGYKKRLVAWNGWRLVLFFELVQSGVRKKTWTWFLNEHMGWFIQYVCKIFRKTNISYPRIRTRTCVYQGVGNSSFSENFANVLNEWSLMDLTIIHRQNLSECW